MGPQACASRRPAVPLPGLIRDVGAQFLPAQTLNPGASSAGVADAGVLDQPLGGCPPPTPTTLPIGTQSTLGSWQIAQHDVTEDEIDRAFDAVAVMAPSTVNTRSQESTVNHVAGVAGPLVGGG